MVLLKKYANDFSQKSANNDDDLKKRMIIYKR